MTSPGRWLKSVPQLSGSQNTLVNDRPHDAMVVPKVQLSGTVIVHTACGLQEQEAVTMTQ